MSGNPEPEPLSYRMLFRRILRAAVLLAALLPGFALAEVPQRVLATSQTAMTAGTPEKDCCPCDCACACACSCTRTNRVATGDVRIAGQNPIAGSRIVSPELPCPDDFCLDREINPPRP